MPWLVVGIAAGFIAGVAVQPDYMNDQRVWREAPWRYHGVIWFPIIGVFCGALLEVAAIAVKRALRREKQPICTDSAEKHAT